MYTVYVLGFSQARIVTVDYAVLKVAPDMLQYLVFCNPILLKTA
jgi:hypothetical protein